MHYGAYAFTRNGRRTILSTKDGVELGQRDGLSAKDKEQLRRLYGCMTKPTVISSGTKFSCSSATLSFTFLVPYI